MKSFLILILLSFSAHARLTYPLQFGIGIEACHPNKDGLTECYGASPRTSEIEVMLDLAADGNAAYGYHVQTGTFEKIGYSVSVKITNFPNIKTDDMLTLNVTTWSLANADEKKVVELEIFTADPNELNRLNLPGKAIGTEENYSNVILSVRKSGLH